MQKITGTEGGTAFYLVLQHSSRSDSQHGGGGNKSSSASAATTGLRPPSIVRTTTDGFNMQLIGPDTDVSELTKALIHFIASRRCQQMWHYEDITRTTWTIHSAEQMDNFLGYIVRVFEQSLPHARLSERWSQLSLQLALSCSSRHYAGRSLQIFRSLRVPISFRMLSDILSRYVKVFLCISCRKMDRA